MKESMVSLHPVVIAAPSQAFFHLILSAQEGLYQLSFSVKDETDIRYYLIEGSNDMISFDRLTRVYAKGNTHLPRTYKAIIYNTDYSCYRIRQIDDAYASTSSLTAVASRNEAVEKDELLTQRSTDYEVNGGLTKARFH